LEFRCGWVGVVSVLQAEAACNTDTTPTQPHRNSNTHRTKNNTTNVVIQKNSGKFLMMDILMSETCWAHKKWNKIASDIELVFYSSTFTMMHGPINIRFQNMFYVDTTFVGIEEWIPFQMTNQHCIRGISKVAQNDFLRAKWPSIWVREYLYERKAP